MIETDRWTIKRARWFTSIPHASPRKVRVIVIHDMEAPETTHTAEDVANYFATTPTKASAHICVDNDSIIQCVADSDVAWAAPGCNNDGIQIEMAGYGNQSPEQWLDVYSIQMLGLAANATAQYCLKFGIPARHLTNAQLMAGARGIVGHNQVSEVYKLSDHTDPGPNFPWDDFMLRVTTAFQARQAKYA
jgi:N-acetyl-anhydromuramyl-L-alanine amidase AmpD